MRSNTAATSGYTGWPVDNYVALPRWVRELIAQDEIGRDWVVTSEAFVYLNLVLGKIGVVRSEAGIGSKQ